MAMLWILPGRNMTCCLYLASNKNRVVSKNAIAEHLAAGEADRLIILMLSMTYEKPETQISAGRRR